MIIRGEADNAGIELTEQEGLTRAGGSEYYRVTLRENDFEASLRVYAFDPTNDGLSKFFNDLASNWEGWDGLRKWRSLEGEFELVCEHDGLGHISTAASLHSNLGGNGWSAVIRFDMLAGELEHIAAGLTRFFDKPRSR